MLQSCFLVSLYRFGYSGIRKKYRFHMPDGENGIVNATCRLFQP